MNKQDIIISAGLFTFVLAVVLLVVFTNEKSNSEDENKINSEDEKSNSEDENSNPNENSNSEDEIYMENPSQEVCEKCKFETILNDEASRFTKFNSSLNGATPLCFDKDSKKSNCCVARNMENNILGCPEFCFEHVNKKFKSMNGKSNSEDEYKGVMRTNKYCNKNI